MSFVGRILDHDTGDFDAGGGIVIEPMRRKHLRQIMPIEDQSYPRPWTSAVFQTELEQMRSGYRHYIVARSGRKVVGYAGLLYSGEDAHVTNIAVEPTHRRERIGARMMLYLARHARRVGFANLTLEVRVSNAAAQALYRRFGFAPVGVRKNYYENVEDAIVMWCHDIGEDEFAARLDGLEAELGR